MKVTRRSVLMIVATGIAAGPALAAELGDPAPALSVAAWVKGSPVVLEDGKGKNVYVIQFWRTTSPPCRAAIPQLTQMQKKYAERNVVFVGVSDENLDTVRAFVAEQGSKMEYRVAVDRQQATARAYLGGFQVRTIPHAFVIDKSGNVVWTGRPSDDLDKTLDAILAGKYDLEKAKRIRKHWRMIQEYLQVARSVTRAKEAAQLGAKIYEFCRSDPEMMNSLAWRILIEPGLIKRDLQLAMRAAQTAYDGCEGKNPAIVDTYALALFETGQKKKALEYQKKAVELAKDDPELRKQLETRLQRYMKAVSGD